jgi:hypothetical protein
VRQRTSPKERTKVMLAWMVGFTESDIPEIDRGCYYYCTGSLLSSFAALFAEDLFIAFQLAIKV